MSNSTPSATGGAPAAGGAMDSPHLAPDGPDRRPSFSYLRRASDRRRRRRMLERGILNPVEEPESPRNQWRDYREFQYPRGGRDQRSAATSSAHHERRRCSESGAEAAESDATQRRDSNAAHSQHRLSRSRQIYDEEGEQIYEDALQNPLAELEGQRPEVQQQQLGDGQHRQSINDRLTDAVSDVMDFVREESVRRGKRHSMIRRRHMGPSAGQRAADGSASYLGTGGQTDDAELDSGDRLTGSASAASYRRRRLMRRSPRRSAAHQMRAYNDSDSGASLSQDTLMGANQRYRLQQHGGSAQDTHLLYGGAGGGVSRGTAILIEQHRRHQSADAARQASHYFPAADNESSMHVPAGHEADDDDDDDAGLRQKPLIRPIPVGASPPPLPASSEHEMLAAARRKREASEQFHSLADEETAIHVVSGSDERDQVAGQPVRFIAPKVAPLSSPSAMLMPDEEVVPPNVPYRGRRLPQIPGNLIKSATNFLHSSIYGPERPSASDCPAPSAAIPASAMPAEAPDEGVFPVLNESPTVIADRASSAAASNAALLKQPTDLGAEGINFPRVSFSPTRNLSGAPQASRYAHAASVIATQAGRGTQSSVLPTAGGSHAPTLTMGKSSVDGSTTLAAWTRSRLPKKEDDDDWF